MSGDGPAWAVDGADESRHAPSEEPLWNESYYMDFVTEDGSLGGYVRLGFYPNLGVAWWTTALVRPGAPSIVSQAFDLRGAPDPILGASGPHCEVEFQAVEPLATFGVRARAAGAAFADPAGVYRGESGQPVEVGIDLTWRTDGEPFHYLLTTRYEIPCLIEGTVTVDGVEVPVRGSGQRDHSWGVRDWWAFGWCWSAVRLDDGTRLHGVDIRMPGTPVVFGYVQTPGRPTTAVSSLSINEDLGPDGFPRRARMALEPGGLDVAVEPLGFGPILLTSPEGKISRFPRALARFTTSDRRSGLGWIEWNQVS
jgi:hypothetical protein